MGPKSWRKGNYYVCAEEKHLILSLCWMDRRINKGQRVCAASRPLQGGRTDNSFLFPTLEVDDSLGSNWPCQGRAVRFPHLNYFYFMFTVINVITRWPEATGVCASHSGVPTQLSLGRSHWECWEWSGGMDWCWCEGAANTDTQNKWFYHANLDSVTTRNEESICACTRWT